MKPDDYQEEYIALKRSRSRQWAKEAFKALEQLMAYDAAQWTEMFQQALWDSVETDANRPTIDAVATLVTDVLAQFVVRARHVMLVLGGETTLTEDTEPNLVKLRSTDAGEARITAWRNSDFDSGQRVLVEADRYRI